MFVHVGYVATEFNRRVLIHSRILVVLKFSSAGKIFFFGSHNFFFLRSDWPVLPVTSRKIPCVPARKSLPLPVKLDLSFCR